VYVDKGVAQTGDGSIQCPFKTILEASSLAAPVAAVTRRTIHVKGNAALPDYNELQRIEVRPRVTLTSDYDAQDAGGATKVRIVARGDCASYTGGVAPVFCAVAMDNDATLEKVTVRIPTGQTTGSGVLTIAGLPAALSAPPSILDVNAESSPEMGFRVYGSARLGPRVTATGNRHGLAANRATGATLATLRIDDAPVSGNPSNSFSNNTASGGGNGLSVVGSYQINIAGAYASGNGVNGILIGVPYSATTGVPQNLANVHADSNGTTGLRVLSGEIHVAAGAAVNTFNGNVNGWGIQATTGDQIGNVRLILDPQPAPGGGFSIAHQANGNHLGGIHLNNASPSSLAHAVSSLEARQNGSAANSAGIFVEIAGANSPNQSSLVLRGSTLLGNVGAGLRFQKGAVNGLDIGFGGSDGYNIFGDTTAASRNGKSGICYENLAAIAAPVQPAEMDRWSQVCPLPLGVATFQGGVGQCGANAAYVEITYTGASAPIPAVAACY
jgi:hypothetical protein